MFRFILKSIWQKFLTLILISILSFFVIKLAPGTPAQIDPLNPRFTKEDLLRFQKAFDLDKPLHQQYFLFYKKFFTGKLVSYKDNQPVLQKIWERFLNSLPLFIFGTFLTYTLAFPAGIMSAIRRGSSFDRTTTITAYALISIPSFVLAYLIIRFAIPVLHIPVLGLKTLGLAEAHWFVRAQDRLWHLVIPSLMTAVVGIAVLSRYVRDQMLEVIDSDYIRSAFAKGCHQDTVYYNHALRNALLPFVTMFGLLIPALIGGSVIIETIFAWPGMGRLGYEAILTRDYPIVIALNFISATLVLMGTWLSDILYMIVDPRIRI